LSSRGLHELLPRALKAIRENFSRTELMNFVSNISKFHRIQGSLELEQCADYIAKVLGRMSGVNVAIHSFDYSTRHGTVGPIVGWDVFDGEVRMVKPREELLHSFANSRTLVVAHSPPGVVEAPVVFVGRGTRSEDYEGKDVEGKIVLAYGDARLVYREASKRGAAAIALFREDAPLDAVPYRGLFLSPEEAREAKTLAVSISRRSANKIRSLLERGEEVVLRISVDAKYRDGAQIKVVEASIGRGPCEIHAVAHICHPGYTVNDNASGAATLLEMVSAISRAIERGSLEEPSGCRMVFLWVPEYSGTIPYLEKSVREGAKIVFAINLDIVGERQEVTGSTLNFIRPPRLLSHPLEALLYRNLLEELSGASTFSETSRSVAYRIDIVPYDHGSDHDIYLQYGIPAVMLNQWPDTFYHTDMDTIDKFDPEIAARIGVAAAATMYVAAYIGTERIESELSELYRAYRMLVAGREAMRSKLDKLSKRLDTLMHGPNEGSEGSEVRYRYVGAKGGVTFRILLERLSEEEFREVLEALEKSRFKSFLLRSYVPLLTMIRPMSVEEIRREIFAEYGVEVSREDVEWVLSILKKLGLVAEIGSQSGG